MYYKNNVFVASRVTGHDGVRSVTQLALSFAKEAPSVESSRGQIEVGYLTRNRSYALRNLLSLPRDRRIFSQSISFWYPRSYHVDESIFGPEEPKRIAQRTPRYSDRMCRILFTGRWIAPITSSACRPPPSPPSLFYECPDDVGNVWSVSVSAIAPVSLRYHWSSRDWHRWHRDDWCDFGTIDFWAPGRLRSRFQAIEFPPPPPERKE